MERQIICLMGPTGAGKTEMALRLYAKLSVEIISVDSVMVYREMNIGTAKPSVEIRRQVPHHLIDIRDPTESYSAGNFCVDAQALIEDCFKQQKIPLLVGGTMLYYRALQQGLAALPTQDKTIREQLTHKMEREGLSVLYAELQSVDSVSATRIHPHDPQRILRALEVFYVTGQPLSTLWRDAPENQENYRIINVGLMPERAHLVERISQRFHQMLLQGFIEEVERLYQRGDLHEGLPAVRSVGYKQAWHYLAGKISRTEMIETAIIATRQLAKRQMTWLRSWPNLHVIENENTILSLI